MLPTASTIRSPGNQRYPPVGMICFLSSVEQDALKHAVLDKHTTHFGGDFD
jgi:hypothetical protein